MRIIELKPIITMDEYLDELNIGYNPLQQWRKYSIDYDLRREIQSGLFGYVGAGRAGVPIANQKYYEWKWANNIHICEECAKPLQYYSAKYISHILTRGAHPAMAHDPRNSRILCFDCHEAAEHEHTHRELKIYQVDEILINILKHEYSTKEAKRIIEIAA